MTSLNQTRLMRRRLGLIGLTAGAALSVTTWSALANPQISNSQPSGAQSIENPVAPIAQTPGTSSPAPTAPTTPTAPTAPDITAPSITPPSITAPSVTTPGATTPGATTPGTTAPEVTEPMTPAKPEAQTPASPTAPQTAATTGTIADVAAASDTFTTLVAALNEAELTEVLQGQGPFTVFAPTDAAFEALPAGTVDELMKPENRALLVQLLKYHVVAGAYPSGDLEAGDLTSAEGSPITVSGTGDEMKVNEANVIQPDITATNGVIHAIDSVMLPPDR